MNRTYTICKVQEPEIHTFRTSDRSTNMATQASGDAQKSEESKESQKETETQKEKDKGGSKDDKYTPEQVLEFWFGKLSSPNDKVDQEKTQRWRRGGKDIDDIIRNQFGQLITDALDKGLYDDWVKQPKGDVFIFSYFIMCIHIYVCICVVHLYRVAGHVNRRRSVYSKRISW